MVVKNIIKIPAHSMLAILDRVLQEHGFLPYYHLQAYWDIERKQRRQGLLLQLVTPKEKSKLGIGENIGILGFLNKKEPKNGTIPLHQVVAKVGDLLSLAYILQGQYKGDFHRAHHVKGTWFPHAYTKEGKMIQGLRVVLFSYKVKQQDTKDVPYCLPVFIEKDLASSSLHLELEEASQILYTNSV